MPATLTETILTVDGIRAPMLQAGPPDADEAVVFVHGNPGSSQDWVRLVERVGRLARAVAWDHPGFGRADKPAGFAYSVEGYAAHLGRCLDVLGVTRAHLVLHDFGGPWGLAWAAAHPAAFASATLINIGVLPRLPLALPRPDLAHAGAWRAVQRDHHQDRVRAAAAPRQPAQAAQSVRRPHVRRPGPRHQAGHPGPVPGHRRSGRR
jgi:pimeloyl-ACP methyl ester carboxylesterase